MGERKHSCLTAKELGEHTAMGSLTLPMGVLWIKPGCPAPNMKGAICSTHAETDVRIAVLLVTDLSNNIALF